MLSLLRKTAASSLSLFSSDTVQSNPEHIWVEPTNRCNTRCRHCGHYYDRFGQDMEESLYRKIAKEALPGVQRAELIGYGEPFMAKHFWTMFDECACRDIEIYTTSNGILLRDDERVSKVVRNRVVLCLSIDGACKETFESVRPYIKWEKMLETLECLHRNALAAGSECRYKLRINFCAMKRNIGELPELVRLAHRYAAEQIFVLPLGGEDVFPEVHGESLHESPELVSPAYLEALSLGAKLGVEVLIPGSFYRLILDGAERGRGLRGRVAKAYRKARLLEYKVRQEGLGEVAARRLNGDRPTKSKPGVTYCKMPWRSSYFASDGTVFPCCIMGEKLGDMNRQDWQDIWNGQAYRNLRRTVHSWNPTAVCRHCALPTGINGGDEHQYGKYFSRFCAEGIPLDSSDLEFGEGFHPLEFDSENKPHHRWMSDRGVLRLPIRREAKFLRLRLIPRCPVYEPNPGKCVINGGPVEPFDNSCDVVHFPLDHVESGHVEALFSMENIHHVEMDPRPLSVSIKGVEILY